MDHKWEIKYSHHGWWPIDFECEICHEKASGYREDCPTGPCKFVAIHCERCGILVGYANKDNPAQISCVECGQKILAEAHG